MNAKGYAGSGIIGYQTGSRFFRHACFNKTATKNQQLERFVLCL